MSQSINTILKNKDARRVSSFNFMNSNMSIHIMSNTCTRRPARIYYLNYATSVPERSLDTVVCAVSASVLPVWIDFTSLKGLPCAPGPATTRRGMLLTNG